MAPVLYCSRHGEFFSKVDGAADDLQKSKAWGAAATLDVTSKVGAPEAL